MREKKRERRVWNLVVSRGGEGVGWLVVTSPEDV